MIFEKYTSEIKANVPDWTQLSKDAKINGDFGFPMDIQTTESWYFYNWVLKNYPNYDIDKMYILKEPPQCNGEFIKMTGQPKRAKCCDQDGQCTGDGTDAWCCDGEFICSSNLQLYAENQSTKKAVLCNFN